MGLLFSTAKVCSVKTVHFRLKVSAAGVKGVSGFLAEGSPPSPSECGGVVSEGVRSHPLECLLRFV